MYDDGMEARERRARGHSLRVAILDLLAGEGHELTVAQIRASLPDGPTFADVSYHLKVLGRSGLVIAAGNGYKLF